MALQRRFRVAHRDVFPMGSFLKGGVEAVVDFNAEKRADGSRPQALDKDTGLLMWQAVIIDADEEVGKRDTALSVKFAAKVQPVPPENKTPFPWTPVEFVGLTALAYVEETGNGRGRVAWSFRAEGMIAPGSARPVSASGGSQSERGAA